MRPMLALARGCCHALRLAEWLQRSAVPGAVVVTRKFKRRFGYVPDLAHPRTMNEKIQWLKLHNMQAIHTRCADKFAVREVVAAAVGEKYLVPLLFWSRDAGDLTALPDEPCVVKANNGASGRSTLIVRDRTGIDARRIARSMSWHLIFNRNRYLYSRELQYRGIQPCLLVEKLLTTPDGEIPSDYKFHCMNGEVVCVQVDFDRFQGHKRSFYDPAWQYLDFRWGYRQGGDVVQRPPALDEMLAVARTLSREFKYVRVDLYDVVGKVFFGELTFSPGSGFEPITPFTWDEKLGDMLDLQASRW